MLFMYGMRLGLRGLLHARVSRAVLKNLLIPVNYWRNLEFKIVLDALNPSAEDRILDIGSPKLLPLYIADRFQSEIYTTDIVDYFKNDYDFFRRISGIPESRFHTSVADGRSLPFPDNHFSKVFSISVIEHIPGDGDMECMTQIGRILENGGTAVITVPFATNSRLEYKSASEFYWASKSEDTTNKGRIFYQRRYSEEDLFTRLIRPSGLELQRLQYLGERVWLSDEKEVSDYLPAFLGPLHPALSAIFHSKPADSWQELRKACGALIVLKKTVHSKAEMR